MIDVTILVNGVPRRVPADVTLAVALWRLGVRAFRHDARGAARAPLCGMGTCFECRVEVDGRSGVRSCLVPVRDGLRVEVPT